MTASNTLPNDKSDNSASLEKPDWNCECGFSQNSFFSIRCLKCGKYRPAPFSSPPSQPKWERLEACPECDGDGCANCAAESSPKPAESPKGVFSIERWLLNRGLRTNDVSATGETLCHLLEAFGQAIFCGAPSPKPAESELEQFENFAKTSGISLERYGADSPKHGYYVDPCVPRLIWCWQAARATPSPEPPRQTAEQERLYICLKCGAESWRIPSQKLTRCDRGECSGQIVANPRRG